MKKGTCFIVGAGDFTSRHLNISSGDLLLAADGGFDALHQHGNTPHILLGDMDSLDSIPRHVPRIVFPKKKNDTDVSLALKYGRKKGFERFALYGISGGRPDHFYANLQLMAAYADMGARVRAVIPEGEIYALRNGVLRLDEPKETVVSIFCPSGTAKGVYTKGLLYPLRGAELTRAFPLGVSNEVADHQASILVENGTLLVFVMKQ